MVNAKITSESTLSDWATNFAATYQHWNRWPHELLRNSANLNNSDALPSISFSDVNVFIFVRSNIRWPTEISSIINFSHLIVDFRSHTGTRWLADVWSLILPGSNLLTWAWKLAHHILEHSINHDDAENSWQTREGPFFPVIFTSIQIARWGMGSMALYAL